MRMVRPSNLSLVRKESVCVLVISRRGTEVNTYSALFMPFHGSGSAFILYK
jgi:hypothetical protein